MIGKGSVSHNSRKFKATNVDAARSGRNIDYCNENIRDVYHQLFDEALRRYNEKQTRTDRRIDDYYEKIRNSKQEKPFHEIILQIGNTENMSADSENGELAKTILDAYYRDFQNRNPNLRVFSAHLHMDEATPHLHIDFVPFTTESKRGLETRVSLKQALAAQGFEGCSRGSTEWNQWVRSEKEHLAEVMKQYGVEWEKLGTKDEHLSVIDYKKKVRSEEVGKLDEQIAEKQDEFKVLSERVKNFDEAVAGIQKLERELDSSPEYQLPEPQGLMTAKAYKSKIAEPLIVRLKFLIKTVLVRYFKALDDYYRLNTTNGNLYRENEKLAGINKKLTEENMRLKAENKDYKLFRKALGSKNVDDLLKQVRAEKNHKRDTQILQK